MTTGCDAVPWTAYMAAALMGAGDATANTVVLSRLGSLADESGLLPRETAFQYFQVANVAMTALAFLYAPLIPLTVSPYQPLLLAFLAVPVLHPIVVLLLPLEMFPACGVDEAFCMLLVDAKCP